MNEEADDGELNRGHLRRLRKRHVVLLVADHFDPNCESLHDVAFEVDGQRAD